MKIHIHLLRTHGFSAGRVRKDGTRHLTRKVFSLKTNRILKIAYVQHANGERATLTATWLKGPEQPIEQQVDSQSGAAHEMAIRAIHVAQMIVSGR